MCAWVFGGAVSVSRGKPVCWLWFCIVIIIGLGPCSVGSRGMLTLILVLIIRPLDAGLPQPVPGKQIPQGAGYGYQVPSVPRAGQTPGSERPPPRAVGYTTTTTIRTGSQEGMGRYLTLRVWYAAWIGTSPSAIYPAVLHGQAEPNLRTSHWLAR